jgi:hypothetical protein
MSYRLRDQGNTIVIIEHNLEVIKTADWIIDLGPEGGSGGGEIIAVGPPEVIAKHRKSHTGRSLREMLPAKGRALRHQREVVGDRVQPGDGLVHRHQQALDQLDERFPAESIVPGRFHHASSRDRGSRLKCRAAQPFSVARNHEAAPEIRPVRRGRSGVTSRPWRSE